MVLCIMLLCCWSYNFCVMLLCFFFKQKTAYEMRISDWSSDVCSSDLNCCRGHSLSCPRGAGEEETLTRGEAMRFECGCFPLFTNYAFDFPPKLSIENQICEPRFRICDL